MRESGHLGILAAHRGSISSAARNRSPPRSNLDEVGAKSHPPGPHSPPRATTAEAQLHKVGKHVGTPDFQHDAEPVNTFTPKLLQYNRYGTPIDELEYDESSHGIMRAHLAEGEY